MDIDLYVTIEVHRALKEYIFHGAWIWQQTVMPVRCPWLIYNNINETIKNSI